jgi:predicted dehydrogenase
VVIEDGGIVSRTFRAGRGERGESDSRDAAGTVPAGGAADPAALGTSSHAAQFADFLAAIDEGRPPLVTAESGRAALEVVRAVYQSAREGRAVAFPVSASDLPTEAGHEHPGAPR